MDPAADGAILFDIGGGSSEIVRLGRNHPANGGPPEPQIRGWTSLPIGVVSLAERYGGVRVDAALYGAMINEVEAMVRTFAAEHCADIDLARTHLLGTSGTVTTIAGLYLRLQRYDRRQVDGCWMIDAQVTAVLDELRRMSYEERVASPCIGAERADLVLAGCAILEAIRRVFPCTRLRVADRGLREGMLVQMMRADDVWTQNAGYAS
jgi:exopolyphosphatase/guanosine-5'-triphosphate,3'-diphosphate pyrophosphatase